MKSSLICIFHIFLFSSLAYGKGKLKAVPINSPVKETYLKVKLEGMEDISSVYFKPKNGGNESRGIVSKEGQEIIAKFKTSSLEPSSYEYRIRVRTSSGNSDNTQASSIAFIKFSIDSSLGVADPGEAGRKNLMGVDTNQNLIRDDIERWINENELDEKETLALKELAKSIQLTYLNKDNKDLSIQYTRKGLKAQICLGDLLSERGATVKEIFEKTLKLEAMMANTRERIRAKEKVSSNFHGQAGSRPPKDEACKF